MSSTEWAQAAQTFSSAELGKPENEDSVTVRAIAVIQASTAVGKSLAYCAPAIALTKGHGRYICKLKLERLAGTDRDECA